MTDDSRGAWQRAIDRIAALRAAQDGIDERRPAGVNPLDLTLLDPLSPGAFPGIGTPGAVSAESSSTRSGPVVETHAGSPSTGAGPVIADAR